MFSRRTGRSRAPNRVAELASSARAQGRELLDLTSSNPTTSNIAYPEALSDALSRAYAAAPAYRPHALGAPSARAAVARYLSQNRAGLELSPENVLLTSSTSEAYAFLFKLLCDAGDAVLVPAPSYPLFEHLAELEGVEVRSYRLAYDGAWHVDLDSLRRNVTPRCRAVVLVSPNNPTGQYVQQAELEALAQLGLPLVCDEVFFEYPLQAAPRYAQVSEQLCFRLGGLSKLAGLPQLKLAWTAIHGPGQLVAEARERLELIGDTYLSVATPLQAALPELLALAQPVTAAIGARCRESLGVLARVLDGTPTSLLRCEGGWSAVLAPPRLLGEDELCSRLIEEQQVLLHPGWFYDFEREPYLVASLLTPPAVLERGARRLVELVANLSR